MTNHLTNDDFDIEIVELNPSAEASAEPTFVVEEPQSTSLEVSEDLLEIPTTIEYGEWKTAEDFTNYIVASARAIPSVFGGSKNSYRRAFSYLEKLTEELLEGVEKDAPYAELSEEQLRTLDSIESGIENAMHEIAGLADGKITKIATKSSQFVYYVNPFIFGLARVLVNGKVSQGHNIESLFKTLNARYKLNDREMLELNFLLEDMGYPAVASHVGGVDRAEQYQA